MLHTSLPQAHRQVEDEWGNRAAAVEEENAALTLQCSTRQKQASNGDGKDFLRFLAVNKVE